MALGTVLAAIREKTGIEFEVSRGQSEKVISIRFESLPLFDGLKRILSHLNHALLFDLDNKLVKVIILDYATADSSPRLREAADALSIQRVFSSSSVEAEDTKSVAVQERVVTSSSKVTNITQPVGEETSSSRLLETMDTNPASVEDMVVTPPTETMIIHPPQTAEEDMIVIPPNGEMASPVEDMIIEGSTGKLYGWSGYAELVQANRP
jgi:hypothetical protein